MMVIYIEDRVGFLVEELETVIKEIKNKKGEKK